MRAFPRIDDERKCGEPPWDNLYASNNTSVITAGLTSITLFGAGMTVSCQLCGTLEATQYRIFRCYHAVESSAKDHADNVV